MFSELRIWLSWSSFALLLVVLLVSITGVAQDFAVVALPDTQNEAQFFPQVLAKQMQWIVENKQALNIGVALGEGDIVNDGADNAQMQNADAAYRLLDQAGVPYFAVIGNHDYNGADPKASRNVTGFNQWFGPARYAGHPFYLGNLGGSNENFYGVVTTGGKQFLVVALARRKTAPRCILRYRFRGEPQIAILFPSSRLA